MTLDIHVTIELQPSPQLVELLQSCQLGTQQHAISELDRFMKERHAIRMPKPKEPPKGRPLDPRPVHTIMEVPMFTDFTTEKPIQITGNLQYAESENGLVMIRYLSGTIYTLWSEIMKACQAKTKHNAKAVPSSGHGGNKNTALNQFIKAVQGGLRKGHAAGSQVDPDADFKPMLQQNTRADYDGGKIEGSLED